MLVYKFDVVQALKEQGYSTYRIRREKLIPEGSMQRLRNNSPIGWETIETICRLLGCQPGDFLQFVPDGGAEEARSK